MPKGITILLLFLLTGFVSTAQTYKELYDQGMKAAKAGSYAEAEELFQRSLEKNPKAPEVMMALGDVLTLKEKDFTAKKYYDRAMNYYKTNEDKAKAYLGRGRMWAFRNEFSKAAADFEEAIKLDPDNAVAHANLGEAFYFQIKINKATQYFDKAIALDSSCYECLVLRGKFLVAMEQTDKAEKDFTRALSLDVNNKGEAFLERGIMYYYQEKYRHTVQDLSASEPYLLTAELQEMLSFRGEAYYFLNDYKAAIKDLETVLEKDTLHQEQNLFRLGLCYMELGAFDQAKEYLKRYVYYEPEDNDGFNYLGLVEIYRRAYYKAESALFKAVKIKEDDWFAYNNLGILRLMQQDFTTAMKMLDKSVALIPEGQQEGEPYFYRAICKMQLQDYAGGCDDLESSLEFGFDAELIQEVKGQQCGN